MLFGAAKKDGRLCAAAIAEKQEDGRYTLTMEVEEGETVSLFLWDSLARMTPLGDVRVLS